MMISPAWHRGAILVAVFILRTVQPSASQTSQTTLSAFTTDTSTFGTTLAPCDPIQLDLRTCPDNIHKVVSPLDAGRKGISVSWDIPELEPTECIVNEIQSNQQPGDYFSIGTTVISYLFHNVNCDQKVYCNFTITITESEAHCNEAGELTCFTSGRCYSDTSRCDSYKDCIYDSDDEGDCPNEEECQGKRDVFLNSCSRKERLQSTEMEIPRRKRQEGNPAIWRFTSSTIKLSDEDMGLYITNVGLDVYTLQEVLSLQFQPPPAEYQIQVETPISKQNVTLYQIHAPPREETRLAITRLRRPIKLAANEDVTVTLSFTPDSLNEPATLLYRNFICPTCVQVNARVFDTLNCDDKESLTCANNFHMLNDAPSCATIEELALYAELYGTQCLSNPEIVFLTNDQHALEGVAVDLICTVDGRPTPMVWWIDESEDIVSLKPTPASAQLQTVVTTSETKFYCKYESSYGSGISKAVVVQPLSPFCAAQAQVERQLFDTGAFYACTGETTGSYLDSYPRTIQLQNSQTIFEFRFTYRWESLRDGAVAFALSVSRDLFNSAFLESTDAPPLTSFLLTIRRTEAREVRKRSILPAIYSKHYENVYIFPSSGAVVFHLDPPVPIGIPSATSNIEVRLTPIGWNPPQYVEIYGDISLIYTKCTNAEFAASELRTDCDGFYKNWTNIIDASRTCSNLDFGIYEAYQNCIGDAGAAPTLEYDPESKTVPLFTLNRNEEDLLCFIDNAIRLEWFKLDSNFNASVGSGNVLRFEVELADQGSYFCVGYGGGVFIDTVVKTASATLIVEGASTFVASVHFPALEFSGDLQQSVHDETVRREYQLVYDIEAWFEEYVQNQLMREISPDNPNESSFDPGPPPPIQPGESDRFPPGRDFGASLIPFNPDLVDTSFRVRAIHPASVEEGLTENGNISTRIEMVFYIYGISNRIADSSFIDSLENILIENLPSVSEFTSLAIGTPNVSTIEITNIGSCPEDETNLPYSLTWRQTQVNGVAESTEKCPEYSGTVKPRGTRKCKGDFVSGAMWQDVIINECFGDEGNEINAVLSELSQMPVTRENVTEVSSDLVDATNTTGINATGLVGVALTLESIINVESPSPEVTTSVVNTIDNILNIDDDAFKAAADQNVSTRILRSLEEQLTILQKQGSNFTASGTNIDVKAIQIPQSNVENGLGFANIVRTSSSVIFNDPDDIPIEDADTSIALPPEVVTRFREQVNDSAMLPATFILYENSKLFQSSRLMEESTPGRVKVVGTRVISATIEGLQINDLSPDQPVVSTYIHKESEDENTTLENFECVFWDFALDNGRGDWSNEGCQLVETDSADRSICHCDHLTSFAVLIDVHGQKYARLALDVISKIGCGISITALIITLITYLAVKSLRTKTPKQILICLCFTLLCLYIVFVIGVDRTESYGGCIFVAALLHYLTLSSVSWMGVEAFNLYLLVVKVFNADVSHFMLKASIAAWGAPLLPVIIVLAADSSQYVNVHHCFMQPSYAFYFADLLIIFLILIFNLVMFVMIIYKLTCGRKNIGRSSSRDKKQSITRAVTAIAISSILGLTWIFGFLTIIENEASSLAFQVLFCIFNSLQGFFIFLLFCVRPEEVRDEWKKWFAGAKAGKGTEFSTAGHSGHSKGGTSAVPGSTDHSNVASSSNQASENMELLSKSNGNKVNGQESKSQPKTNDPSEKPEPENETLLSKSEDSKSNDSKTNE